MKKPPSPSVSPSRPLNRDFQISRRTFLAKTAALAALTGLPSWFVERQLLSAAELPAKVKSPNARPGVCLVGCGGMGTGDAVNASNYGDILAVCDVDDSHAAAAAEKFTVEGKVPDRYSDFRRVLERKDIHVILNGTPDHWHTLVNIAAARAGKDVYSEKPLTLTIDEGKHVVTEVRKHGIVLQTGTQQRSSERFRLACELIRNGRIGRLKQAIVWLPAGLREGPFKSEPVPAGLNWDFWQGQAPATDYIKQRCHRYFRFWYDYSGGTMTDWGAHHNDIAYWAIGLVAPRKVEAERITQPIPGGYDAFADYAVHYEYENGVRLDIQTTRDDDIFGEKVNAQGQRNGIRFEGTDGWIWVNRSQLTASDPALLRKEMPENAVRLPVSKNHMGNFFECVHSREKPICDVEIGHRSATICHLGAIALRTGAKLTWNSIDEKFEGENASKANAYLSREMRKPYNYDFCG